MKNSTITGVPSGFPALDNLTGGWQNGTLTSIATANSDDNVSIALDMALAAAKSGIPVLYFNMTYSTEALLERLRRRPFFDVASVETEHWRHASGEMVKLSGLPLFIDSTPGFGMEEYYMKMAEFKQWHGRFIAVIDSYGLLPRSKVFQELARTRDSSIEWRAEGNDLIVRLLRRSVEIFRVPVLAITYVNSLNRFREKLMIDDTGLLADLSDNVLFIDMGKTRIQRSISVEKGPGDSVARFTAAYDPKSKMFIEIEINATA